MRFFSSSIFVTLVILLALPASGVTLAFPNNTLATMALVYGKLTNKKVSFSDDSIKDLYISAVTGDTELTESQAIKFLESAFYLKGIEVIPADDGSVILTRYAKFQEARDPVRHIIRSQKSPQN